MESISGQRILVCSNPISGRGQSPGLALSLVEALRQYGAEVVAREEPPVADCRPPAELASVIVVGGDGTLRGVANWLAGGLSESHPAEAVPPILFVPTGTANLMGRHLGIHWREEEGLAPILRALGRRRIRPVDTASANGKLMLLVAGAGIDGAIVHELDRRRRGPITKFDYTVPSLLAAMRFDYPSVRVSLDGHTVFDGEPAMVFVGNVREYGTGFPVLPLARSDDGLLDVCIVPCGNLARVVRIFMLAAGGELLGEEGVVYRKCRTVRIESSGRLPVEVDGEAAGFAPLEIAMRPHKLAFIV